MIVLQKDAVRQIVTVIIPAAHFDSIFLEDAHIWCRFPGIQELRPRALQQSCNGVGIGGDPAHSLEIIQCRALPAQKNADVPPDCRHMLSIFYCIAVLTVKFYRHLWIQKDKDPLKNPQAGYDAILFADELYFTLHRLPHNGIGRNILTRYILFQCLTDQTIRI